jgi:NAD-dependent dihydropyrimidine dehydrogenase PreA subunit
LQIDQDLCASCGQCIPYCPMSAIKETPDSVIIVQDECVECGVCKRSGVCPTDALTQPKLEWPRLIRSLFSDPITVHPGTGVAGRGTDELKTNDVTDRFVEGQVGFGVEMGRPNTGTTFRDLEKVSTRLASLGVYFEPANPVTELMKDTATGELQDDIKDERVLTAIIEFIVDEDKVLPTLEILKEVAEEIDTVFSLDLINRVGEGEPPCLSVIREHGYYLSPNGKVCIGIGRRVTEM